MVNCLKYFDKCLFLCDSRNNIESNYIVVDFYFTEKEEQIRRTYRFVLDVNKKEVDVFERPVLQKTKVKKEVGEKL